MSHNFSSLLLHRPECTHDGWLTREDCSRNGLVCLVDGSNTGCRSPVAGAASLPKVETPEAPVVQAASSWHPPQHTPAHEMPEAPVPTKAAVIKAVKAPEGNAITPFKTEDPTDPLGLKPSGTFYNSPSKSPKPPDVEFTSIEESSVGDGYTGPSNIKAPHYVIYWDWPQTDEFPTAEELGGFNRFILCFWMVLTPEIKATATSPGKPPQQLAPFDRAEAWATMAKEKRSALKASYTAKGIALMVSAFGQTGE